MKKLIFAFGILLPTLMLSGCFFEKPPVSYDTVPEPLVEISTSTTSSFSVATTSQIQKIEPPPTDLTAQDVNQNSQYKTLRKDLQINNQAGEDLLFTTYEKSDCYGLQNGVVYSEDLLHMLINNDKARTVLKPQAYTKQYTQTLFDALKKYHEDNRDQIPAAFYLCHFGKDLDIVLVKYFYDESRRDTILENAKGYEMFFYSKAKLYNIPKVQQINTVVNEEDSLPCHGTLQNNKILWTCFTGFIIDDNDVQTFRTYRDWSISLDGRILTIKDREIEI